MRQTSTVRTRPCLAAFGLFVLASLASRPLSAAQTETLDNGAVTATFEDGALVRLRSAAANRTLELNGDSCELTVSGEKFAARSRPAAAERALRGMERAAVP